MASGPRQRAVGSDCAPRNKVLERFVAAPYTAILQESEGWWFGWIGEIPGVNAQARTRQELLDDLSEALAEALEMNRAEARSAASGAYEEVSLPA